ncbi:MAG TPA: M48 family metallopeptidase [Holophagaceae bacterium]|nr:M48 family metallopeptidase [Holophagaceae bacterium]
MSSPLKPRHGALLGLTAVCALVMVTVGRHATPQQRMTLAPVVDRGTEALKAVDEVGLTLTRLSPEEVAQLDEDIQARFHFREGDASPAFERDQRYVRGIYATLGAFNDLPPGTHLRLVVEDAPNAFALPGGTILVTTGMVALCANEAELAEVIAHEVGHHKLGHPLARLQYERAARKLGGPLLKDLATLGYTLYSRGYSARDEEEADRQGLALAGRANYHPQAVQKLMARMQTRFGRPESAPSNVVEETADAASTALMNYFATHPPFPDRILKLERARVELGLDLEERRWFLGTLNHQERVSANERERPEDFLLGKLK